MSTNMSRGSSLQAEEPPVQMQEGRRVCVQGRARRQVWLEERGIDMRSVSGQIMWASRILEGV